jgi:hypothetical protein
VPWASVSKNLIRTTYIRSTADHFCNVKGRWGQKSWPFYQSRAYKRREASAREFQSFILCPVMKFSSLVLPVLAGLGACLAGPTSPGPNMACSIFPDLDFCQSIMSVCFQYVRVLYTDGALCYFDYEECYPYTINGAKAAWAVWLKSMTCYEYS